jgi:hypothetical protein
MSKRPPFTPKPDRVFRTNPNAKHETIDEKVRLPYQVRHAAAVADAHSTGQPLKVPGLKVPRPKSGRDETRLADAQIDNAILELDRGDIKVSNPLSGIIIELARVGGQTIKECRDGARKPRRCRPIKNAPERKRSRSKFKIQLSDSQINAALKCLHRGDKKLSDPVFSTIITLAREGAKIRRARRDGARKPREQSVIVTRRLEAELRAFEQLSAKRQHLSPGRLTRAKMLRSLEQILKIPEHTLRNDLKQIAPLLRLVRKGVVLVRQPKAIKLSPETQREMVAGKRTLARHRCGARFLGNS